MAERHEHQSHRSTWSLAFLALGIVFGDIGTSPLYALRETFLGQWKIDLTPGNVLGVLSLFFWSMAVVVTLKYVSLIMRADNEGEGGVFALLGLLRQSKEAIPAWVYGKVGIIVLLGAGLLYGDGIITPAISILSAVEGLEIIAPAFKEAVVLVSLGILFALFAIQKRGTHRVGRYFAPAVTVWFLMIAALSLPQLWANPGIFRAINPLYGLAFIWNHGWFALLVIGAVSLCITGVEALYADMGHLGRPAISRAWLCVWPALVLNYFGQGARLLDPAPIANNNLFYALVPSWAMIPVVIVSTLATIIASQAVITGCFSLTQQAIALGVFPRLKIVHTNQHMAGQIYLPFINWSLFAGCAFLMLAFRNSGALAAAYGLAVTGTMAATTAAFYVVARYRWQWPGFVIGPLCAGLIVIDLAFFASNAVKFFEGGFVPLVLGLCVFGVMWTWQWGRKLLAIAYGAYDNSRKMSWLVELKARLDSQRGVLRDKKHIRQLVESDRVAVFMTSRVVDEPSDNVPVNLRIFLKRNGVLPKYIFILNIVQERVPYIRQDDRYRIIDFGNSIVSVQARYGFMQSPDARRVIRDLGGRGLLPPQAHRCIIEVGEEEFIIHPTAPLRERIFGETFKFLLQMAVPAHKYFGLGAVSGLAKTLIPVSIDAQGVRVELPEFALDRREEVAGIDPDTLEPTEVPYTKPKED